MAPAPSPAFCAACGAALSAGARFCHKCGTPVGAAPAAAPGSATILPWSIAAVSLIVLITLLATRGWQADAGGAAAAAPSGPVAPFAGGGGGAPPDISRMSPEERATRLYDRIMSYAERGATDSAAFFAPMAMMAYQALAPLNADQRYDMGSIGIATGDREGASVARAQADTILRERPTHLLGLMLAARASDVLGEAPKARAFEKRFLSALDAELKGNLPEYTAHRGSIDAASTALKGQK